MVNNYLAGIYAKAQKSHGARALVRQVLTTILVPSQAQKARQLARSGANLKLHLGCGNTLLDGWINLDLVHPTRKQQLHWDLRRGIPFPDESVQAIFTEHMLEHLTLPDALTLLKECRRVLNAEGILRIGVPDLERYALSYLGRDPLIDLHRPCRPTRGIAFSEIFFFYGHRSMYDFDTLNVLLREAGFSHVARCEFGSGSLQPCPDSSLRADETLYVEAFVGGHSL